MASITLSIGSYSVVITKFAENPYPRRHKDPQDSIKDDPNYEARNVWEFTCLLKPLEATALHQVYAEFLNRYRNQTNSDVDVTDTTGLVFEATTTFKSWFVKQPEYSEEGALVRAKISLREANSDGDDLLNGLLTMSVSGASATLYQRHMEEKFPRIHADGSVPKVEYTIMGATLGDGPFFPAKHLWNVVYNATNTDRSNIEAVKLAFNELRRNRQPCNITVVDSTMGGTNSYQAWMINFPQYQYNKEGKDRIFRVQFSLQEV